MDACGMELNIWLFDRLDDGIIDFSKKAGVKAEDLPTEEEAKGRSSKKSRPFPPLAG